MAQEYQQIHHHDGEGDGSSRSMGDDSIDTDSLWNELNHQQSREIHQHRHRTHPAPPTPSPSTSHTTSHTLPHNTHYHNYGIPNPDYYTHPNPTTTTPLSGHNLRQAIRQTAAALSSAAVVAVDNVATASTAVRDRGRQTMGVAAANWGDAVHRGVPHGGGGVYEYHGPYSNPRNGMGRSGRGASLPPLAEFGMQHSSSSSMMIEEGRMPLDAGRPREGEATGGGRQSYDDGMEASLLPRDEFATGRGEDTPSSSTRNFVLLNRFRLRPQGDGWGVVADLDLYLDSLYSYYYHKGLAPIVGRGIVELITLFFTLCFSVFLVAYLDWAKLFRCADEESCEASLGMYIVRRPFRHPTLWNLFVLTYILLFSAYGVFSILSFVTTVRSALESKRVFEDRLGIAARKLEGGAVEWHEVVKKLLELQRGRIYRVAQNGEDIKDELVIAQRIMRRENFMIAFFNRNLLDLTVSAPSLFGFRSKRLFYSKSLEWSIYVCVLGYMFNHKYRVRPTFYTDPASLRRRFIVCGIAHAVCMPFLLSFMTLHFFMQNVYDFRSSEQYLGPRDWSNVAKWKFREFNELPHVFERRLGPSYEAAEEYVHLFGPSSLTNAVGRVLVFLSGSIVAVLLMLAAINDAILLYVKLGNWNLLWYVGVLGLTFSIGKGMLPDPKFIPRYHHNIFAEMDGALAKVSSHTHHYPEFWKKRGWDDLIKAAFSELYQYKAKLFLMEIVSVIVAPAVLCFSLPNCAADICSFVQQTKVEVQGTGDHCGYSTFDFDLFEDESWEGQKMGVGGMEGCGSDGDKAWANCTRGVGDVVLQSPARPKARHGKMEKSFFNFKTVHPEWKCSSSGQDLIDRMERYQTQQATALARERRHYVEAATRQLETLQKLKDNPADTIPNIQPIEKYLATAIDGNVDADRGGGRPGWSTASNKTQRDTLFTPPTDSASNAVLPKPLPPTNGPPVPPTPPTLLQHLAPGQTLSQADTAPPASSVLHYTDIGLSTELQRVLLDRSSTAFELQESMAGGNALSGLCDSLLLSQISANVLSDSVHANGDEETRRGQRQYMWLEKYHSQLNSDRRDYHRS